MSLAFENLAVRLGQADILKGASLFADDHRVTGIVGPNGSGKSTLVKTLFALVPYQKGTVALNGQDVRRLGRRELARHVGYVGQEMYCAFDFSVEEIVAMGRFPHKQNLGAPPAGNLAQKALKDLGIFHLAGRNVQTLSGGEKKMVFLARAIAQDVEAIVLDEPTNHLDIKHQLFILDYLRHSGKTILLVLHDLTLAARYCDTVYLLHQGKTVASGPPLEVLSTENIKLAFEVEGHAFLNDRGRGGFVLE